MDNRYQQNRQNPAQGQPVQGYYYPPQSGTVPQGAAQPPVSRPQATRPAPYYAQPGNANPYSYPYPAAYPPVARKVYPPFSKKENIFLWLFLASAFLFVDFALFKGFHLGFTVAYAVLFVLSTVFLWKKETRLPLFPVACGVISLFGAVTFTLYDNYLVNALMFFLIAGLYTVYCVGISGTFTQKQGSFKMLADVAKGGLLQPFAHLGDVFGSLKASTERKKRNLSALLGVLVAIPVLVIVVYLLVKSDAAFEGLVGAIAKNIGLYLLELILAAVLLPFLLSFMLGKKRPAAKSSAAVKTTARNIPIAGCVSFLCVISLTYLIYLFSQLAYFFSAFEGFLPEGYEHTASAFARRGFFEMFAICVINVTMIAFINAFSRRNEKGKTATAIKGMSLFVALFSVLMIATAMQKMRLNISTYGFTANRLLVSMLMLMMLVVFLFFILHIFVPKLSYMQPVILICSCLFVALSFANINALTAQYNIQAYENGTAESLDVAHLASLGGEALDALTYISENGDIPTANQADIALCQKIEYDYEEHIVFENGEFCVVDNAKDFRRYCRTNYHEWQRIADYMNALDKESHLYRTYLLFHSGYYDEEENSFDVWEEDSDENHYYVFNEKTGEYDETEPPYAYDYDDEYDYDDDYDAYDYDDEYEDDADGDGGADIFDFEYDD